MKTVFKTFISTFIIAFFISFAIVIIDKIFNQIYNPKDVFFVGFIFWIYILIVGLIMDVLDKDDIIDSKSNHFYMPPPPPMTKDNIRISGVYEKERKKEENIRLNLTLAYLNYTKNSMPPLQDETEIIEKFYQYVKEGQKPKKPIQDEI